MNQELEELRSENASLKDQIAALKSVLAVLLPAALVGTRLYKREFFEKRQQIVAAALVAQDLLGSAPSLSTIAAAVDAETWWRAEATIDSSPWFEMFHGEPEKKEP